MEAKPEIQTEVGLFKNILGWLLQAKATLFLIIITTLITLYGLYFIGYERSFDFSLSLSNLLTGNYFSLISQMFLHWDIPHLLGNMLFLLVFGRIVEKEFGSIKMLFLYFGAGIFSGLFYILVQFIIGTDAFALGASGAISGLIAATLLFRPFQITFLFFGIPLPVLIVGWLGIAKDIIGSIAKIIGTEVTNVAYFSHIGGYVSILLILFFILRGERATMVKGLLINLAFAGILFLVHFGFGIRLF